MTRFHFRPFLGLTLFTVVSLIILITLGTWQYQRLQWKTALLDEVEQAVTAPPLGSLSDVSQAIVSGAPVDFRRFEAEVDILPGQKPFLVYSRAKNELMWRPFLAAQDGGANTSGRKNFVALAPIPDSARDDIDFSEAETLKIAGYVRLWRAPERGSAKSTPSLNRWFGFDPLRETSPWSYGWAGVYAAQVINTEYYIDVVKGETSAEALPIKRPQIRNNHFDYMLTWYGLAVALFVIYIILHVQRGRLGFRKSA